MEILNGFSYIIIQNISSHQGNANNVRPRGFVWDVSRLRRLRPDNKWFALRRTHVSFAVSDFQY